MEFYQQYCKERFDADGNLTDFVLCAPPDFNFGYDVVDRIALESPDRLAMVWYSVHRERRDFTFDEMRRMTNQAANVFRQHGIGRGDRVMLILKRRYELWPVLLALHKLGAVAVPVSFMLTGDDLVYRMRYVKVKAVVAVSEEAVVTRVKYAKEKVPSVKESWLLHTSQDGFGNLVDEMNEASDAFTGERGSANDPMVIYFTSGTTGNPKAVVHNHLFCLTHIITARYWQQTGEGDLHLSVADTGWAKALWGKIYGQWMCGAAVFVYDFDLFDPKQLMTVMNEAKVTTFCAPPTIYRFFVKNGYLDFPFLKHACTAGEALSSKVSDIFYKETGLHIMAGYGQTETSLSIAHIKGMVSKNGSLGKPTPLYHIELLQEDGSYVSRDDYESLGEIVLIPPEDDRVTGVFLGYVDDNSQYSLWNRKDVYHTGDSARRDKDGYYWFNGRIDNVIKTGGFRVGPHEIEKILMEHEIVMECSVVGVPDPLRGQAIQALVVLTPGNEPTKELNDELREWCNGKLANYKRVRSIVFVDELPKTISGKIRKNIVL